jgi:threonine synthase
MLYLSTRGDPARRRFCEILLEGLAPDGGLYMPERYPQVDVATLDRWRGLAYPELALKLLSLYIDDIPPADLRAICAKTYTQDVFGTKEIVPLKKLEDGLWLEALSNGPTLAFKDMAMQLLGHLFEYELERRGEELNILGATSGDTGSAAEYAMRGKKGVRVFMTSPHGRMSTFQQAQMFSLQDENIHNLAIEGVFDDCQIWSKRSPTTWRSSAGTGSAPSTRSTGRACSHRSSTTSRAISRPRAAAASA